MVERSKVKRPIVKYTGSKWMAYPKIAPYFPYHFCYCELFGGSGAILLQKPPKPLDVYNEIFDEMTNVFRVARDHGDELLRMLELTPHSRNEYENAYIYTEDDIERARRAIVRSQMGYGAYGLSAPHKKSFNTSDPETGKTWHKYFRNYVDCFHHTIARLKDISIESLDALDAIDEYDHKDTFFYADPPYVISTVNSQDDRLYKFNYSDQDHVNLAKKLNSIKGKVMVSGYPSELYNDIYRGWNTHEWEQITQLREYKKEVIWMNYSPDITDLPLFKQRK